MGKLPAFQFYPGDWLKDPNLRRCSHAAKGVWIDMLCLMFECEERGVLATAGRAWTREEIARAVGGDSDVTLACIDELTLKGTVNLSEMGAYYSKRMVRDEHKRQLCREAGKRGGNPQLTPTLNRHPKGHPKGRPKGRPKGELTPSSSSSTSVLDSSSKEELSSDIKRFRKPTVDEVAAYCQERGNGIDPESFVNHYDSNGWKIGGKSAMKDWQAAVRNWESRHKPPASRVPTAEDLANYNPVDGGLSR